MAARSKRRCVTKPRVWAQCWLPRHFTAKTAALALKRVKATRTQVGLGQKQRQDNMRGAFRVADPRRFEIEGRRVLLIDDVYTTGATAQSATRALKRAGARDVDVLVFARVGPGIGTGTGPGTGPGTGSGLASGPG